MITTLLLIRHGFSTSNEDGTLTGQIDVPLTPLGVLQGEAACRYILAHYRVDALYSSDLIRAKDTVCLLADALSLPIRTDADFREMDCGAWSGEPIAALKERYGAKYTAWSDADDSVIPEGGEAWSTLAARAYAALLRTAKANEGKTVAVATHGGTLRALRGTYLDIPMAEWRDRLTYAPNAALTLLTYDGTRFSETAIIDSYLGTLKTEMPKGI